MKRQAPPYCLPAIWPAPEGVQVVHTVRWGGVSTGSYMTWNLGDHVADDGGAVASNRDLLQARLGLTAPVQWLDQVHGTRLVAHGAEGVRPAADGVLLQTPGEAAVVLTADCLPVVLCRPDGSAAAVVHAGWRGLAQGILSAAVTQLLAAGARSDASELMVWLGPCILPRDFEVGEEVRAAFLAKLPTATSAFLPLTNGRWQGLLSRLAYLTLRSLGCEAIYGFGLTSPMPALHARNPFFSHRRAHHQGCTTGRFATVLRLR